MVIYNRFNNASTRIYRKLLFQIIDLFIDVSIIRGVKQWTISSKSFKIKCVYCTLIWRPTSFSYWQLSYVHLFSEKYKSDPKIFYEFQLILLSIFTKASSIYVLFARGNFTITYLYYAKIYGFYLRFTVNVFVCIGVK